MIAGFSIERGRPSVSRGRAWTQGGRRGASSTFEASRDQTLFRARRFSSRFDLVRGAGGGGGGGGGRWRLHLRPDWILYVDSIDCSFRGGGRGTAARTQVGPSSFLAPPSEIRRILGMIVIAGVLAVPPSPSLRNKRFLRDFRWFWLKGRENGSYPRPRILGIEDFKREYSFRNEKPILGWV